MRNLLQEFRFLNFRRVPIYWHSSVWLVLILASLLTKSVIIGLVAFAAYLVLILAHEIGHALVAQSKGIRVFSLHVSAFHGRCISETPESLNSHVAVAWGGIAAQLVLLLVALMFAYTMDLSPDFTRKFLSAAFFVWIPYNIFLIFMNLLPLPGLDGAVAWRIFEVVGARRRTRNLSRSGKPQVTEDVLKEALARISDKSRLP